MEISKALNRVRNSEELSVSDNDYVQAVRNAIMEECNKGLEELLLTIISSKAEMKDDERLRRLNNVYEAMKDKAAFTQSFMNDVNLLIRQKRQDAESINQLKKSYGITN